MDDWVEVSGADSPDGSVCYWNCRTDETSARLPAGVSAHWVKAVHPTSGHTYYWNRETSRSSWVLPSGKVHNPPAAKEPASSSVAAKDTIESWADSRERLQKHLLGVREVQNRTDQVADLLPGQSPTLLLELSSSIQASALFPPDFHVMALQEDIGGGVLRSPSVCPGFLIVDIISAPDAAPESLHRFIQCWWSLVKHSPMLSTFIFAAPVSVSGESFASAARKGAWTTFRSQHTKLALRSPAPLLFAAPDPGGVARTLPDPHSQPSARDGSGKAAMSDPPAPVQYWADEEWEDEEEYEEWDHHAGSTYASSSKKWRSLQDLEEELCWEIAAYLKHGAKDVQDLAANFAVKFNAMVRNHPDSHYNPDKKNDGSFKKWLITCGFEVQTQGPQGKVAFVSVPDWWVSSEAAVANGDEVRRSQRGRKAAKAWSEDDDGAWEGSGGGTFEAPHGQGSPEAEKLAKEVLAYLSKHGPTDMGALRQVKDMGKRFNEVFFQRSKVNNGSWKKWLISLPNVETVVDPARAYYHGNQPTMVQLRP
mmetsp:Transcript_56114/g.103843  ORF Transcript_56114/g.103843 Transcript_56114/m.103843 type:complete len:536 (+) Transcript_56114:149-1756(+)